MADLQNRPLRVFLCHASEDKPAVREIYLQLEREGWIDAWLDVEKLYPGQDWNLEIERAVEAADVIIVFLTKNSVNKEGYVQRELRIVLDQAANKPEGTLFIVPVRLEDCEPPRRLRPWQFADYFPKAHRDRAQRRLLVSLQMRAETLGILKTSLVEEKSAREGSNSRHKTKTERKIGKTAEITTRNGMSIDDGLSKMPMANDDLFQDLIDEVKEEPANLPKLWRAINQVNEKEIREEEYAALVIAELSNGIINEKVARIFLSRFGFGLKHKGGAYFFARKI